MLKLIIKKDIKWDEDEPNDFHFVSKLQNNTHYTLRVSKISENNWWSCLYIKSDIIWDNNEKRADSEKVAKTQVLKAINDYIRKENKKIKDNQ